MPQFSGRTGGPRTGSLPPSHNTSPRGIFAPQPGQSTTRETPQALEAAQGQSASLTFSTNRAQTVEPSQGQSVTLVKSGYTKKVTQSQSASLTKELSRALKPTQSQSASLTKELARTLTTGGVFARVIRETAGLVGYWRLNDTSGATATDLAGSNDGTYADEGGTHTLGEASALADGDTGARSVYLKGDGKNFSKASRVQFGENTMRDTAKASWSLLVDELLELPPQGGRLFDDVDNSTGNTGIYMQIESTGKIFVQVCNFAGFSNPSVQTKNAVVAANGTYLIHVTYDEGTVKIYVNGEEKSSEIIHGPIPTAIKYAFNQKPCIGSTGGGFTSYNGLNARLSEFSYYNVALSPATVKVQQEARTEKSPRSTPTLTHADADARTLSATQAQSATYTKALARTLSASNAQADSLTKVPGRALSITQAQALSAPVKALERHLAAAQASSPTVTDVNLRVATLSVTQPQTVVRVTALTRSLSSTQGQVATKAASVGRALTVAQGQSPTRQVALNRTLSMAQPQEPALLTITAFHVLLAATQSQVTVKIVLIARALAASQGQTASKTVALGTTLSLVQPQSLSRAVALARTLSQAQEAGATAAHADERTLSVAQPQVASEHKVLGRALSTTQPQAAVKAAVVGRALSLGQAQTSSKRVVLSRHLSITQPQGVTMSEEVERAETEHELTASQGQTVTRTTTAVRKLPTTVAQVPSKSVAIGRRLTATQVTTGRFSKAISRTIKVTQPQSPKRKTTLARAFAAEQGQEAGIVGGIISEGTLVVEQPQAITLRIAIARTLRSTQVPGPSLAHSLSRAMNATQGQQVRATRLLRRKFVASDASHASLTKQIGKVLTTTPVQSIILTADTTLNLLVEQGQLATVEGRVPFYPGVLSSSLSSQGIASDTATGVTSSTSSTIISSSDETSIASSVEPVVNIESGAE